MNILIDSFDSTIKIGRGETKKLPSYFYEEKFDYPLNSLENQLKALGEFFKRDEAKILSTENSHDLVISDEIIGFGTFDLPHLSRFKIKDVFNTRFKINFPNYKDYYLDSYEFDRNQNGSVFFFSLAKKHNVNQLTSFFKAQSVNIKNIDYFANNYIKNFENKSTYPVATLFMGEQVSELIISKGPSVLSVNTFDFGSKVLLTGDVYLHSAYGFENDISKKYSGFIKENFATKEIVTDESIMKTDPTKGLDIPMPRETRILKDQTLVNYNIKNNIRKYYSMLLDIVEFYSGAPWFLPIGEIKLVCSDEFYDVIKQNTLENFNITFVRCEHNINKILDAPIAGNKLFSSNVKGERRKIDWAKFFSLEIGRSKKRSR